MTFSRFSRLLFGSSFVDSPDPTSQLKHLKRSYFFLCIAFVLVSLAALYFMLRLSTFYFTPTFDSYELRMPDLTPAEQAHVRDILTDWKPVCSQVIRTITVAHDITPYLVEYHAYDEGDENTTMGLNPRLGSTIFVKYRYNSDSLKRTITHETLHSVMRATDEAHDFIYELSWDTPCFTSRAPDEMEIAFYD